MASKKRKTTKLLHLLLDACVVIEAHRLGTWNALVGRAHIACPAMVVKDEALFYQHNKHSVHPSINLPNLVAQGKIEMLEATADDLAMVAGLLTDNVTEGLDPGETEALALLLVGKAAGYSFCTGDRAAIHALALLGLSEKGVSFEQALTAIGATKPLQRQFTEIYFQAILKEGQEYRLRGLGLRLPST